MGAFRLPSQLKKLKILLVKAALKSVARNGLQAGAICGLLWSATLTFFHFAPAPINYYYGPKLSLIFMHMVSLNLLVPLILCALFGVIGAILANLLRSEQAFEWATAGAIFPILFCLFMPDTGASTYYAIKAALLGIAASTCTALFLLAYRLDEAQKIKDFIKKRFWFWFTPILLYILFRLANLVFDWIIGEEAAQKIIIKAALLIEIAMLLYLLSRINFFQLEIVLKSSTLILIFWAVVISIFVISPYIPELSRFKFNPNYKIALVFTLLAFLVSLFLFTKSTIFQHLCGFALHATFAIIVLTWAATRVLLAIPSKGAVTSGAHPPNIVLITFDALRADVIEPYGGTERTPNFARFARDGIVFENALTSATWTLPSTASLITGLYQSTHEVSWTAPLVDPNYPTLQNLLKLNGYHTYALVDQFYALKVSNIFDGFDTVIGISELEKLAGDYNKNDVPEAYRFNPLLGWVIQKNRVTIDHAQGMIKFLKLILPELKQPFLLWIYFLDPHQPYMPPKKFLTVEKPLFEFDWIDGEKHRVFNLHLTSRTEKIVKEQPELLKRVLELYKGEVRYADHLFGKTLNILKKESWYSDSVVALFADHGEEFMEHGGLDHGRSAYKEVARVPLIVKMPGHKPERIRNRVCLFDLFPTILDLAGENYSSLAIQAKSLSPVMSGKDARDRDVLVEGSLGKRTWGLYSDNYLVIRVFDELKNSERFELYDLIADPDQKNSLPTSGKLFESLRVKLVRYIEATENLREKFKLTPEDESRLKESIEKLKALGYIQ